MVLFLSFAFLLLHFTNYPLIYIYLWFFSWICRFLILWFSVLSIVRLHWKYIETTRTQKKKYKIINKKVLDLILSVNSTYLLEVCIAAAVLLYCRTTEGRCRRSQCWFLFVSHRIRWKYTTIDDAISASKSPFNGRTIIFSPLFRFWAGFVRLWFLIIMVWFSFDKNKMHTIQFFFFHFIHKISKKNWIAFRMRALGTGYFLPLEMFVLWIVHQSIFIARLQNRFVCFLSSHHHLRSDIVYVLMLLIVFIVFIMFNRNSYKMFSFFSGIKMRWWWCIMEWLLWQCVVEIFYCCD